MQRLENPSAMLSWAQLEPRKQKSMAGRGGRDYSAKPQTNGERFNLIRESLSLLYYADYKSFRSTANQNRDLFGALRGASSSKCPCPAPSQRGGKGNPNPNPNRNPNPNPNPNPPRGPSRGWREEVELHPKAQTRGTAPWGQSREDARAQLGKAWMGRGMEEGYGHLGMGK